MLSADDGNEEDERKHTVGCHLAMWVSATDVPVGMPFGSNHCNICCFESACVSTEADIFGVFLFEGVGGSFRDVTSSRSMADDELPAEANPPRSRAHACTRLIMI